MHQTLNGSKRSQNSDLREFWERLLGSKIRLLPLNMFQKPKLNIKQYLKKLNLNMAKITIQTSRGKDYNL